MKKIIYICFIVILICILPACSSKAAAKAGNASSVSAVTSTIVFPKIRTYSPLIDAVEAGQTEKVTKLVYDSITNFSEPRDYDGNTALHIAILNWNTDIIKLLIDKGDTLHIKNTNGETPMMLKDINGRNLLQRAIIENKPEIIYSLVSNKILENDPFIATDNDGNTSLHLALLNNSSTMQDIAIKILNKNIPTDIKNNKGDTCLSIANANKLYGFLSVYYYKNHDYKNSSSSAASAIEINPKDITSCYFCAESYNYLAQNDEKEKNYKQAIADFDKAIYYFKFVLASNPDNACLSDNKYAVAEKARLNSISDPVHINLYPNETIYFNINEFASYKGKSINTNDHAKWTGIIDYIDKDGMVHARSSNNIINAIDLTIYSEYSGEQIVPYWMCYYHDVTKD